MCELSLTLPAKEEGVSIKDSCYQSYDDPSFLNVSQHSQVALQFMFKYGGGQTPMTEVVFFRGRRVDSMRAERDTE